MTEVQAVEQGILRAVGKILAVLVMLGILVGIGYSMYTSSEAYQDRKAQEKLIRDLGGTR